MSVLSIKLSDIFHISVKVSLYQMDTYLSFRLISSNMEQWTERVHKLDQHETLMIEDYIKLFTNDQCDTLEHHVDGETLHIHWT